MSDLTPRQIVAELDRYIIGQDQAKRAVAVAVRNRWRRLRLPENLRADVGPKNIMMIGPTGVGKTEIARRLARLVNAPFIKVEATRYTEVGYHGRDVESMVRDLVEQAVRMVRQEQTEVVRAQAERLAEERLLDALVPAADRSHADEESGGEAAPQRQRSREKLRALLHDGQLDDREVEITAEDRPVPVGMMAAIGVDQLDPDIQSFFERLMPQQNRSRRVPVREARRMLFEQACEQLIDREKLHRQAVRRAEETGIIFLDEIDKIAAGGREHGPDVSRQGVQRDLLPVVEGCTVNTRYGPVRTDHILFIAAGAFHGSRPSDLMPELQGRFPIRVELGDLTREDFIRILTQPQNALTRQQIALLATEGVQLDFTDEAIEAMAGIAEQVNRNTMNIGARRLYTIVEKVLEDLSFEAPERAGESVVIDAATVRRRLAAICADEDVSRYIL